MRKKKLKKKKKERRKEERKKERKRPLWGDMQWAEHVQDGWLGGKGRKGGRACLLRGKREREEGEG